MAIELIDVINALTEDASPDPAADFVMTKDTSASALKKVKPQTFAQLASVITALTAETTIDAGDYVMIYDASAGALRKMLRSDFVAGIGASSPLTLTAAAAGDVPLTSKGHASQTAHLQDWSNSAGTPLAYITKDGYMAVKTLASVTVPTLFSDGDTNTGVGFYGSDILTLILGGVTKVLLEGNEVRMDSNGVHSWNNTTAGGGGGGADTGITRGSAGFVKPTTGTSGAGGFHLTERTAPSAPATNNVLLYAQDNGGNTEVVALFPTGSAQVMAREGGGLNVGKQTIWIPASSMIPATTSGAASAQLESATNKLNYGVLDFDGAADEYASFIISMPKSWDEGPVTFQVFWQSAGTDTDAVVWGLQGISLSDNETIDTAFGTAVTVTDNLQGAANELYVSAESGAVTIGGSPVADDLVFFRFYRDADNGSDTASEDARLLGIKLFYTTNAVNDA